ncbi:MAG TPA: STAS domain-containing protein [Micromonosporaceae bacterium]|nr:STAS domain-containing protein [Micromonosporaceae bacterium]
MKSTFDVSLDTVDTADGVAVTATVTGEVDVTNASDLARSVDNVEGPRPLILDLSYLRYLDSAGFAVIYRLLERRAVIIVLSSQSPIHKAATLIGLTSHESIGTAVSTEWKQ